MESYPGQCNTPDGRHFVQQLSDEEKKKLVPSQQIPQLITFESKEYGYSFKYSADWKLREYMNEVNVYTGGRDPDYPVASIDFIAATETFEFKELDYEVPKEIKVNNLRGIEHREKEASSDGGFKLPKAGGECQRFLYIVIPIKKTSLTVSTCLEPSLETETMQILNTLQVE